MVTVIESERPASNFSVNFANNVSRIFSKRFHMRDLRTVWCVHTFPGNELIEAAYTPKLKSSNVVLCPLASHTTQTYQLPATLHLCHETFWRVKFTCVQSIFRV